MDGGGGDDRISDSSDWISGCWAFGGYGLGILTDTIRRV